MRKITDILGSFSHRPWELPVNRWSYYQEWNKVLFLHWEVPADAMRTLIPKGVDLDIFEGKAYVSLVPFTMEKIRPRGIPAFSPVSDFHEINLRTYVTRDGKPGVYFISIESSKGFSAYLSRHLSGLPYEKALVQRQEGKYVSSNAFRKFFLDVEYAIQEDVAVKSPLEKWLTERYALYVEERGKLYRFDTHHREWKIKSIDLKKLHVDYKLPGLEVGSRPPDLAHYSDGVEVVAWRRVHIPNK